MNITFLLNGETVALPEAEPTRTLLDWLRETRGLTGTKEGCNEGDCGACTVLVGRLMGEEIVYDSVTACIRFMGSLHGTHVVTIEHLRGENGNLHPVQQALIDHHGSQCGFCTPGFVMSMVTAHKNGATDHDVQLAGNLCRCTGYASMVGAAEAAAEQPV
ncbi:2Fe-2S iron-sulfur cluster-binding protein, partial [uncultured Roseovarius sp.]|uniref:2Fe-2S iron-sulfur cluster-binding protein n=1 Tax=uncultured Roseovarius sp. TaxID=293344 RepID=UPI0025F87730